MRDAGEQAASPATQRLTGVVVHLPALDLRKRLSTDRFMRGSATREPTPKIACARCYGWAATAASRLRGL